MIPDEAISRVRFREIASSLVQKTNQFLAMTIYKNQVYSVLVLILQSTRGRTYDNGQILQSGFAGSLMARQV